MTDDDFNPNYYSDANVETESTGAANLLRSIFGDDLNLMEYSKIRQIGREIQGQQTMTAKNTREIPMRKEIVYRFIHDSYGVNLKTVEHMTGLDAETTKSYLKELRHRYNETHIDEMGSDFDRQGSNVI